MELGLPVLFRQNRVLRGRFRMLFPGDGTSPDSFPSQIRQTIRQRAYHGISSSKVRMEIQKPLKPPHRKQWFSSYPPMNLDELSVLYLLFDYSHIWRRCLTMLILYSRTIRYLFWGYSFDIFETTETHCQCDEAGDFTRKVMVLHQTTRS